MRSYWAMLVRDRVALAAAAFLALVVIVSFGGYAVLGDRASLQDLLARNRPPFSLEHGWSYVLGSDVLGRSVLYRLVEAGSTSLSLSMSAAFLAALIGASLGIAAGYRGGWFDALAMRLADVILSFPLLLIAILFLYILEPRAGNIVVLLVIGRLPLYLRVTRAETLEVRKRLFIDAARCLGASGWRLCTREIAPVVAPTVLTLVALDVGLLMLLESALSFLGIGLQPPAVSWGGMVSDGRRFIASAWWLSFFPGLAIFLVALCCNVFSNWLRLANDPMQRWRLEKTPAATVPA